MKVFYDSTIFSRQTIGGISRYFVELINHLPDSVTPLLGVKASENLYLNELHIPCRHLSLRRVPDHRKLYRKINGYFDRRIMHRGDYDIIHPTDYNTSCLTDNSRPMVLTVHDLIHKRLSGWFSAGAIDDIDRCIMSADALIAISHATKKDMVEYYGLDESRISVIHHGYMPVIAGSHARKPVDGRYILFVGKRGGYKNFDTLLKAFSIVAGTDRDLKLVCTGRPFTSDERRAIRAAGVASRVEQHMFATAELGPLYAGALCYVFPSKLEGFGMPVLEAFAARTPVALSDASCLPEIAADAAMYFNPDDADDIAATISRIIYNPDERQRLIDAGTRRLADFSWEKTAEKTARVYDSVLRQT
ncbi:MAG: glycosyltransferase family 4 protein [Muribaculaceae bacterium]|nr:glycosyltransferase family 4 protein [Muribaculaceae bacterium]